MRASTKYAGALVEYLDQGRLRPGLVVREHDDNLQLLDASGREKTVARDLVLIHHRDRKATAGNLAEVLTAVEQERAQLRAELDLDLLWGVVHEQARSFNSDELAELFFGRRSSVATSVMLEALLNDRLYFVRRHLEFVARSAEQVERLRVQNEKARRRSDEYRKTQSLLRGIIADGLTPDAADAARLIDDLSRYLRNPSTRSNELTAMLAQAAPEVDPAELAFEILARLGKAPHAARFAIIGGLKMEFGEAASLEAADAHAAPHPALGDFAITIDDEETLEIDDAISCEPVSDGELKVRIHIALVADFVRRGGAMDTEAAARAATVYLPEATVRMLPDEVSCRRASLVAGEDRPVLTTEVTLSSDGELLSSSIYPASVKVAQRLDYETADRLLDVDGRQSRPRASVMLEGLHRMASKLRERRRRAGAALFARTEPKVKVRDDNIEIRLVDNASPSRQLVAEFMVLSNFVAAKFAADNRIPIIYRVQPGIGGDLAAQRPRLSLYPELHAGVGLDRYAQLSSPIRRYADLVLQRQLVAALSSPVGCLYRPEELLTVVAAMENTEAEGKELERRAKRYWILRYLEQQDRRQALKAIVTRDGVSAELGAYAVRGALRGAPNVATGSKIVVEVERVSPLRGSLALRYLGPDVEAAESASR
jgi:exoribonuclease II